MTKVDIPRVLQEMRVELQKSKALMGRLDKGQKVIAECARNQSITKAHEAILLFNRLSRELNDSLERAAFMHEILTTGRTTLISREGKPVNPLSYPADETVAVDLFALESIKKIREVFGDDFPFEITEE